MRDQVKAARSAYQLAVARVDRLGNEQAAAGFSLTEAANKELEDAIALADEAKERLEHEEAAQKARMKYHREPLDDTRVLPLASGGHARISVDEPDQYGPNGRSFLLDLYSAQLKNDPAASDRIARHHVYEVEKYSTISSTLGGIVPPQYLVQLYAQAPRNGRVLADQMTSQPLPPQGMSLIIPRLTAGSAAAIQASENSTVTTQDPTETDLTVNVRTIAGYLPVSRQTLERAAYSESILFEDLIARYNAALDTQLISGSGSSGQHAGVLNVSGTESVTFGTASVASLWSHLADALQRISTNVGAVGLAVDRIVMHPRRFGWLAAQLDSNSRPILLPATSNVPGFNTVGSGSAGTYGYAGQLFGIDVFTDANIPTNLGSGTNEDRILVFASRAHFLWEDQAGPVTLGFEQQAGTALTVELVAYGYSAATWGRFPNATAILSGAGLATPTFA